MATKASDQDFLEYVIKALVDHPESVKTQRKIDEMGVLITLSVHAEDMGQIIGQRGNTARAIRSLLRIVGMKNNARVNLKIEEPEGGSHRPSAPRGSAPSVEEAVGDLNL